MIELRPGLKSVGVVVLLQLSACQARSGTDARTASESAGNTTTMGAASVTATAPSSTAPLASAAPATPSTAPTGAVASSGGEDRAMAGAPPLFDDAGNPLPQTEVEPAVDSPWLRQRLELLVRAIAEDAPELAVSSFFPVEAYKQVKAIAKPEQDWTRRLLAAFARNVHEYHRQLGGAASSIRFARLEVPAAKVKWMKPGSEGNRVGYYRVTRSKLIVTKSDASEAALEVTSMISWRGEWYVVHLHGFE